MTITFNRDKMFARGTNKESNNKILCIFQLDKVYREGELILEEVALEIIERNEPLVTLEFGAETETSISLLIKQLEGLKNDI